MRSLRVAVLLLPALALATGCTTPAPESASPASPGASLTDLRKGMTGDAVRALLGDPAEVRPGGPDHPHTETWVYRRDLRSSQRPVAATMVEIPYFDPITGAYRPFKEPNYNVETVTLTQTLELVLVDGQLHGLRRTLAEEKSFR